MAEPSGESVVEAVPAAGAPLEVTREPAAPVENSTVTALREALRVHERPLHVGLRALVFVVSLAAFAWFMRDSGPVMVAIIIGVLALHELGHFVAMKALGYENMRVFFVPFLGAAVAGRARTPGGWRAGVVSLAGPVPGVLLAAALAPFATASTPLLRAVVLTLVVINGLNLLPFVPLDGGRLLATVLFSRHRFLEFAGTLGGVIGLLVVPDLLPGSPAIWAGIFGGVLIQRAKAMDVTDRLRRSEHAFEGLTSALPEASLLALQAAAEQLPGNALATQRGLATTIASLHEAAATRPARWGHSIALFLVWAGALGIAWASWHDLKRPRAHWEETVGPGSTWRVEFPSPPKVNVTTTGFEGVASLRKYVATSLLGEFSLLSVELEDAALRLEDDPTDAETRMRAMVKETGQRGITVLSQALLQRRGRPALEVAYTGRDGRRIDALYIAEGNAVHVLITVGTSPGDQATFRESFRVLR